MGSKLVELAANYTQLNYVNSISLKMNAGVIPKKDFGSMADCPAEIWLDALINQQLNTII